MLRHTSFGLALALALTLTLALAALSAPAAEATTFCVPTFTPACSDNGTNVAEADLETALAADSNDDVADTVNVAAGTYTDPQTFQSAGGDRLTVVGAGPTTILTSAGACNCFVADWDARQTTVRDLAIHVPPNFPDNQGAAALAGRTTMQNVSLISKNPGSSGLFASGNGNLFSGGTIKPAGNGTLQYGVETNGGVPTTVGVSDTSISGASYGLSASSKGTISAVRMRIGSFNSGVYAGTGGIATITNSVIRSTDNFALQAQIFSGAEDATLEADHVTMIGPGAGSTDPALSSSGQNGQGYASLRVSNSIATGYQDGYFLDPGIGAGAEIVVDFSNIENDGTATGEPPDFNDSFFADPQLTASGSLARTSPSVDAASRQDTLATDILKAKRPQDGDSDGSAYSDQGAFELANLPPNTTITSGPGAKLAQRKAKFGFSSSEPFSKFKCSLDGKAAALCTSPKLYEGLKPGQHVFRVFAIDNFGAKDATPAKRSFNVPQ